MAARKFLPTTAPQIIDKLERIFRTLENEYGVRLEDKKIVGLDGEVLQRWFIALSNSRKPATVNAYVCALNPFLRWAHKMSSSGIQYLAEDLSGVLSC